MKEKVLEAGEGRGFPSGDSVNALVGIRTSYLDSIEFRQMNRVMENFIMCFRWKNSRDIYSRKLG